MSAKTVITCDHCGKEIPNNCDERFSHMGCNAAFAMGTIDACSREHLGLALAKAFGLPIDTKAADLFVEHAKSEARRVFLETETRRLEARIAELERQERDAFTPNPISMMIESWANPQKEWDAANGKTPGQVLFRAQHKSLSWDGQDEIEQEQYEKEAHAVLRAFGQPRQTTQDAADALRRVRDRIDYGPTENWRGDMRRIIDDELAKLKARPVQLPPDTSTESGLPDAVLASITLPTKPTKPLVDYEPLFWKLLASLTLADNIKDVANDVGEAFEQTGAKMHDDATDVWENIRRHCIDNGITTLHETELSSIEYEEGEDDQ